MISVAGAPVSFGVFELGAEQGAVLPGPDEVCEILRRHGYTGIDLGPVGFLGHGDALRNRLRRYGLSLAGGWIDLPFSDDEAFPRAASSLEETLDIFADAASVGTGPPPLPTLADRGSDRRRANPGGGANLALDEQGWEVFARNLETAARLVRERGLEPTFHHHACTFVETPEEIDRLLQCSDVGLTFDTGHLILGGGDPVADLKRWGKRINHVHIKDARVEVLRSVVRDRGEMHEVWSGKAFVPLGRGDLDVDGFMDALLATDFSGWLVVEQDTIPLPGEGVEIAERDHAINRDVLRKWIP